MKANGRCSAQHEYPQGAAAAEMEEPRSRLNRRFTVHGCKVITLSLPLPPKAESRPGQSRG